MAVLKLIKLLATFAAVTLVISSPIALQDAIEIVNSAVSACESDCSHELERCIPITKGCRKKMCATYPDECGNCGVCKNINGRDVDIDAAPPYPIAPESAPVYCRYECVQKPVPKYVWACNAPKPSVSTRDEDSDLASSPCPVIPAFVSEYCRYECVQKPVPKCVWTCNQPMSPVASPSEEDAVNRSSLPASTIPAHVAHYCRHECVQTPVSECVWTCREPEQKSSVTVRSDEASVVHPPPGFIPVHGPGYCRYECRTTPTPMCIWTCDKSVSLPNVAAGNGESSLNSPPALVTSAHESGYCRYGCAQKPVPKCVWLCDEPRSEQSVTARTGDFVTAPPPPPPLGAPLSLDEYCHYECVQVPFQKCMWVCDQPEAQSSSHNSSLAARTNYSLPEPSAHPAPIFVPVSPPRLPGFCSYICPHGPPCKWTCKDPTPPPTHLFRREIFPAPVSPEPESPPIAPAGKRCRTLCKNTRRRDCRIVCLFELDDPSVTDDANGAFVVEDVDGRIPIVIDTAEISPGEPMTQECTKVICAAGECVPICDEELDQFDQDLNFRENQITSEQAALCFKWSYTRCNRDRCWQVCLGGHFIIPQTATLLVAETRCESICNNGMNICATICKPDSTVTHLPDAPTEIEVSRVYSGDPPKPPRNCKNHVCWKRDLMIHDTQARSKSPGDPEALVGTDGSSVQVAGEKPWRAPYYHCNLRFCWKLI